MKEYSMVFVMLGVAMVLIGAFHTAYQLYALVKLDAESRGLKHPKFWGLMATGGNNSSGLLLYLIGRRKYPVTEMTPTGRQEMDRRKRRAGVGLIFLALGAVLSFLTVYLSL